MRSRRLIKESRINGLRVTCTAWKFFHREGSSGDDLDDPGTRFVQRGSILVYQVFD